MLLAILVILPFVLGGAVFFIRSCPVRRGLLLTGAGAHLILSVAAVFGHPAPLFGGLLCLDALGGLFLLLTSVLFAAASVYALGYLAREDPDERRDFQEGAFFSNAPQTVFIACLFFFLGSMTVVTATHHLGLLWVGIEATTLASAPLIYFHRHHRSLEATWKYLVICSVGIALALIGNILLAASSGPGGEASLYLDDLLAHAPSMNPMWFKAAFVFLIVGYGTKMGLAPLHTWLPDAHSESPSLVSALLSGALLNCAFLGILRGHQIGVAAGLSDFCSPVFVALGLFSMAVAAAFIIGQGDFKRILAYSSVEHMGILSLAVGLGGAAAFGGMLHAAAHSVTKAMLFLLAGNILAAFHTKSSHDARGVIRALPVTGVLWVAGFLAITGSPPFGIFVSELTILKAALDAGGYVLAAAYLGLLGLIFCGMAVPVLRMAQGRPTPHIAPGPRGEDPFSVAPPLVLAGLSALLGLYPPPFFQDLLHRAAILAAGL
ncbi:proton-conducting transporter membrane subunit [Desulfolutivibrio sulfoxidireducens]|uniref:proton-conducting transporter transmembrane domain-containing protein n=1 Tax=Desulfolutivibrio sulfoxidireducens TaxID=2773299 RepID=UPI00159E8C8F|nr:proton-conducting transporter membrane subunit [Desulfolutivibrio sulfoxidireducens]QLA21155.1 NADH dehydrogenase FAD-containing subunit [Desulfolutivibrio sulfoxidireducens]